MIRRRARLLLALVCATFAAAPGCDPSSGKTTSQRAFVNRCASNDDCADGEACASSVCYALNPTITDVVFEVIPGQLSAFAPGQSFLVPATLLSLPQQRFDIVLPPIAQLAWRPTLLSKSLTDPDDPGGKSTCAWSAISSTKSVAMHASLFPVRRALGLPATPFAVAPSPVSDGIDVVAYRLTASLPPGMFNVYLEPTNDADCEMPPLLLRNQELDGNQSFNVSIAVSANTSFAGTIRTREGVSLEGWRVDIIDPSTGLRLSTRGVVGAPTLSVDGGSTYNVAPFGAVVGTSMYPLQYMDPTDPLGVTVNDPTLRLRPPVSLEGAAPTFVWSIPRVLDIANTNVADIDLRSFALTPVDVSAQIERSGTTTPVAGVMLLRNQAGAFLGIDPGLPASLTASTQSGDAGLLEVGLLPGKYDGLVIPDETTGLARSRFTWTIGEAPIQAGRVEELVDLSSTVIHAMHGKRAEAAANLPIQAIPSPNPDAPSDPFANVLPRRTATFSDVRGNAVLRVDPGRFDIVARSDRDSRYAWSVFQGVTLPADPPLAITLRAPFSVEGQVLSSTGGVGVPIQGGVLRVYARTNGNAPYVQIGETTISDGGASATSVSGYFRLLLPPQLLSG